MSLKSPVLPSALLFLTAFVSCACTRIGATQLQKKPIPLSELSELTETLPESELGEVWVDTIDDYSDSGQVVRRNIGHIHLNPLPDVGHNLIGGRPALVGEFPATVYSSSGGGRCTANVIGHNSLIIAAHCVGDGKQVSFVIADKNYSSVCTHAPDYRRNQTADWALCKSSQSVTGIKYESLNLADGIVSVGEKVVLTGYGCTQAGGSGGNDGILRVGESPVTRLPSGQDFDIITRGEAALCFGDSGGPAYKYLDPEKKKRLQISVNSRGDIRTTSYLSSTGNAVFKAFLDSWVRQNAGVEVCGFTPNAKDCHNGAVEPEPGELPAWCGTAFAKFQSCLFGKPRHALTEKEACRDTYATLFACEEAAEIPSN